MLKYILAIFCIISYIHSAYLPFKKNKNFPDDTCSYIAENNIAYVKDCDGGKYCNDRDLSFSICEDIPTEIKLILENGEENCDSDFQCESGLECVNKKCIKDCGGGYTSVRTKDGYSCVDKDEVNLYYTKDFTWHPNNANNHGGYITDNAHFYYSTPIELFKVKGKITMHTTSDNDGKIYEPEKIEFTDIGTVEDGQFVYDEKACSSGFALYFYGDGSLTKPYKYDSYNIMYKKCVTLEEIEKFDSGSCKIKYKVGDGDAFNYNADMLSGKKTCKNTLGSDNLYYNPQTTLFCSDDIENSDISSLCGYNKIKLKMFKNYIAALTDDKKKCPESELFYSFETCKDNTLRKWTYFYFNPDDYILYYDEKKEDKGNTVVNYLLQKTFPSYQFTEFLNIKYIICLLFLLYL